MGATHSKRRQSGKTPGRRRGGGRPFAKGNKPVAGFKPGQSGNPGGLPKSHRELRALFLDRSPEAADKLLDLMRSSGSEKIQREAAEAILDRAGLKGFAVEPDKLAVTDAEGKPLERFVVTFQAGEKAKADGSDSGNPKPKD